MNDAQKKYERESGRRLKAALESAGMSQKAFAKVVGKSEATVTGYVQGATRIPLYVLGKVAQICNVSLNWLILGTDTPTDDEIRKYVEDRSERHPEIGRRIKEIIEKTGMKPADLGKRFGWDDIKVRYTLEGTLTPNISELKEIAMLGEVTLDWLIAGEDTSPREKSASAGQGLDKELVRVVIEAVEEGLGDLHLELKPDKKAQLVITLCEMFEEEKQVDKPTILRLIKLAA